MWKGRIVWLYTVMHDHNLFTVTTRAFPVPELRGFEERSDGSDDNMGSLPSLPS
jgi:hypothetical protein